MKHYLGPLLCALVAACSNNAKPAESPYGSPSVATSDTETELVPASSDGAESRAARKAEPMPDAQDPPDRSAPDTIPPAAGESRPAPSSNGDPLVAPDNTKVNRRDTDGAAPTPIDQGENASDLKTTQEIRKAVVADGALSFTAKNVKIITMNGKVTLRGPVKSAAEREKIAGLARKIAGTANVDNQLEVAK